MTARDWLQQNGYEDVAALIDEVMVEIQSRGSKERCNWWEILAGGANGKPHIVAGREFPVLYAAQRRQGKPITSNAIRRSGNEIIPKITVTGRWSKPK